jgi:hypothetical protein
MDSLLEIIVMLRPPVDRRPRARGPPEPALVVGPGIDAGGRELGTDVLVSSGVLRQTVE